MSSSALRGAFLVALAVLLGFLILRGAADNEQTLGVSTAQPTPTAAVEAEPEAVELPTPTSIVITGDARENSQVTVLVANGTAVSGQASRLTSALRNQGFLTREPRNSTDQATSTIFYRPGYAAEATVVRDVLGGSTPIAPMPEPDPFLGDNIDLTPVNVLVLVGNDALATS